MAMPGQEHSRRGNWKDKLRRGFGRGSTRVAQAPSELHGPDPMRCFRMEMEDQFIASRSIDSIVDFPVENVPNQDGEDEQETDSWACTAEQPTLLSDMHGYQPQVSYARSTFSNRSVNPGFDVSGNRAFLRSVFNIWDNRLALKLFGSRRGILKEEERLKNCQHWIIHPCSKFRIYWDMLMLVFLLLNVVFLPVVISFYDHQQIHPGSIFINVMSDVIFVTDVILNFWTGVISQDNTVILNLKEARKLYVKKWLPLDIMSILPFDYVFLAITEMFSLNSLSRASRALRLLKLIKFLSLLRVFRVVKMMHYLAKWEEMFHSTRSISLARIINFVLAVLLLAHWNGCIQFLVPYIQGFPRDSWVSINNLQDASVGRQYSWAVFKAISHMLCIGFGRWPPQNTTEVWITIISMLIGASLYAMFIGHISNLIHSVHSSSWQYNEKLKQVDEYMRYRKLPGELKRRIHEYYYQRFHGQLFDEESILIELSTAIREDIVKFNCQELVRVVPFFASADDAFITSVITRLKFDVFLPGDYIIRCGAIGTQMYFIQHGVVDVITRDGKVATCLCDGSYFGEICLLMKCHRVASVKAVTVCDLYSLSRENFDVVLEQYPHMRRIMETVAKERLSQIKESIGMERYTSEHGHGNQPMSDSHIPSLDTITDADECEEYAETGDVV